MTFYNFFNTYCRNRGFTIDPDHVALITLLDQQNSCEKGWYIWGDVGRGKSTIAKAFYEYYPDSKKEWFHFTNWVMDIQKQLALEAAMQSNTKSSILRSFQSSPLEKWVKNYKKRSLILFLDELSINHISEGIIIQNIFALFLKNNIKLVLTSNTSPESLYAQGFNRERLSPLLMLLEKQLKVVNLKGNEDFRYLKISENFHYFLEKQKIEQLVCSVSPIENFAVFSTFQEQRLFTFDKICENWAFCSFDELCTKSRSLQDYKVLFSVVHTLFLYDLPKFDQDKTSSIQRFIILIDFLYDHKISLAIHGLTPFEDILGSVKNISLKRTFSRLVEMLSKDG